MTQLTDDLQYHLFVEKDCQRCHYVERALKRVEGWEDAVIIHQAKEDGELTDFAKECGVRWIPCVKATIDGKVGRGEYSGWERMSGKWFWEQIIRMYKDKRQEP